MDNRFGRDIVVRVSSAPRLPRIWPTHCTLCFVFPQSTMESEYYDSLWDEITALHAVDPQESRYLEHWETANDLWSQVPPTV